MTEKIVQLMDISPHQHNFACLPFGIEDWSNCLLPSLHYEVMRRHGENGHRELMASTLAERYQLVTQNRHSLASLHQKAVEDIRVYHLLSSVQEANGIHVQFLYSDIYVPLNDAKMRFSQRPLCFILNEDLKTWKEIAPLVEQQCEVSAVASAAKQQQEQHTALQVSQSPKRSKRALNS